MFDWLKTEDIRSKPAWAIAAALILPIAVLAVLCLQAADSRENGTKWRIGIGGYDPRHPLHGHYLTHRYLWRFGENSQNCEPGSECCLCLNEGDTGTTDPEVSLHSCGAPELQSCAAVAKGESDGSGT